MEYEDAAALVAHLDASTAGYILGELEHDRASGIP